MGQIEMDVHQLLTVYKKAILDVSSACHLIEGSKQAQDNPYLTPELSIASLWECYQSHGDPLVGPPDDVIVHQRQRILFVNSKVRCTIVLQSEQKHTNHYDQPDNSGKSSVMKTENY